MTKLRLLRLTIALGTAAALMGCSVFKKDEPKLEEATPGEIFQMGEAQLADGKAKDAAK